MDELIEAFKALRPAIKEMDDYELSVAAMRIVQDLPFILKVLAKYDDSLGDHKTIEELQKLVKAAYIEGHDEGQGFFGEECGVLESWAISNACARLENMEK